MRLSGGETGLSDFAMKFEPCGASDHWEWESIAPIEDKSKSGV